MNLAPIFLIFIGCVVIFALALMLYSDKENTAAHQAIAKVNGLNSELIQLKKHIDELKSVASSNISTIMAQSAKIEALTAQVTNMKDEIQVFRDQVSDTREKQIQIRDDLSKKRPIFRPSGPIQIEIMSSSSPSKKSPPQKPGKGIKSLIREGRTQ